MTFVVLVTGGRGYNNRARLWGVLDWFHEQVGVTGVVHGLQSGADHEASMWAYRRGVRQRQFGALWLTYGDKAGPERNRRMWREMRKQIDAVLAFPGFTGTCDMLDVVYQARDDGRWSGPVFTFDLAEWLKQPRKEPVL